MQRQTHNSASPLPQPTAPDKKLAYVYFEEEPGRRSAAKLFAKDEARRIAVNTTKLCGGDRVYGPGGVPVTDAHRKILRELARAWTQLPPKADIAERDAMSALCQ